MRHSSSARIAAALAMGCAVTAAHAQAAETAQTAPGGLLPLVALSLAAAALVISILAFARTRASARDMDRLNRAIDGAMSRLMADMATRADTVAGAQDEIRHRLDALTERVAMQPERGADGPPLPAPRKAQAKARSGVVPGAGADETEAAISRALAADRLELSLQPIVSVSANQVRAFETYVHVQPAPGQTVELRRPAEASQRFDRAAFEARIVLKAVEIGRRRLGAERETLALHCPITRALLDEPAQSAAVVDILNLHPAMARTIVLSAPSPLLVDASRPRRESLEPLLATGTSFAAEGWDAPLETLPALRASAVDFLKLEAQRLLDRDRGRRKIPPGFDVVAAAADCGIIVIATGVDTDEDAVNLLDIGVDLMIGARFGPPRRLRSAERESGGDIG